jgi:hypothetical protein
MRTIFFLPVLLVVLLIACNKKNRDDFSGDGHIAGRLTYVDLHSGNPEVKQLPGKRVYIAYSPSDTANFLYSTVTDAQGYFVFKNLEKGREYDLFAFDTATDVRYRAVTKARPDSSDVQLTAVNDTMSQNVLIISTLDETGNPLPHTAFCLFNNLSLAVVDTCYGSIFSDTTEDNGYFVKRNLTPGTYYVRVNHLKGGVHYKGFYTVDVRSNGVALAPVRLGRAQQLFTAVELQVLDTLNTPVPAAKICVFTSKVLFGADTCFGSMTQVDADSYGVAKLATLKEGTYYLRAYADYGNIKLKGMDSIVVEKDKVKKDTMFVR